RNGDPKQSYRAQQLFPCKNARLHAAAHSLSPRSCARNQRSQLRQQPSANPARLLSYLAKSSTPSPAPLALRLRPPTRHHHVRVVGGSRLRIARVPLTATLFRAVLSGSQRRHT